MPDKTFTDVYLSAEQVTEPHRTLENDHTVTEVELPGTVNVYLHIDGAKLLFTSYKAGKVLDALDAAAQAQSQSDTAAQEQAQSQSDTAAQAQAQSDTANGGTTQDEPAADAPPAQA